MRRRIAIAALWCALVPLAFVVGLLQPIAIVYSKLDELGRRLCDAIEKLGGSHG